MSPPPVRTSPPPAWRRGPGVGGGGGSLCLEKCRCCVDGVTWRVFGDHKGLRHWNFKFLPKNICDENNINFLFDGYVNIKINFSKKSLYQ